MDAGTIQTVWKVISVNLVPIVVILGIFVEVTPVKVNPVSAVMEFLLKSVKNDIDNMQEDFDKTITEMNTNIATDIEELKNQDAKLAEILSKIEKKQDRDRFTSCRWEILSFASSINNGTLYTEQEYQHIYESIDLYNALHKQYEFENGHTDEAILNIKTHHDQYKDTNVKYF